MIPENLEDSASAYVFPSFEYLIDELLPTQEIHLIGGPTGAGKTTWLLRLLDQWRRGERIFGFASHPAEFLYVSLDRSRNGMLRILQRMRLDPRNFNLIFPSLADRKLGIPLYLQKLVAAYPAARLIVVEGFQTGVENINDQKEVTSYLANVQTLCVRTNITVLGVVHTSKAKQNAKYENPRERIAGCGQWGGWSETVIMVEPQTDPSGAEADLRNLQVLPRNGKHIHFVLEFRDGLLVERTKALTNEQKIIEYCLTHPEPFYHRDTFRAVTGLPDSSLTRLLNTLIDLGRLSRIEAGNGTYRFHAPKQPSN
jgi:hypothetical protein